MWEVINQRSQLIREPHEVRILRLVRDSGEISRVEIAKACNLNKAYVTELVARLIQAGFLEETGKVEANGKVGRKRVSLKFLPLSGLVAGVDIGMTHTTVIITDLNATVLVQETFIYQIESSINEVLQKVIETINKLLVDANISKAKLVGIGVGIQGLIDYSSNSLIVSHNKKSWEGEPLSSELESHFNVPVYIENDVKAQTLSEYLLGNAKGIRNFVYLYVGDGLGAGLMINGHLHRGFTSSAGEIGYTELEPKEFYKEQYPLMYDGQVIFGQILTDANIVQSYLRNSNEKNHDDMSVTFVAQKALKGDAIARGIIEECTSLLSVLSIHLINTLNPELIIIGGKIAQCCPLVVDLVREKIHKDLLSIPAEAVRTEAGKHGEDGVALGAASLVLFEMFEPIHNISIHAQRRKLLKEKNIFSAIM